MLWVQVSLPPPSHSSFFFFFRSQKTLCAFENFVVEVALPAASFKLFVTSARLGHQLNTWVKQKMLKVYALGAAVVFPTCPAGNGSRKNVLCPSVQPDLVFFLRKVTGTWVGSAILNVLPTCVCFPSSARAELTNSRLWPKSVCLFSI